MNIQCKPNIFNSIYRAVMRFISLLLVLLLGMFASLPASAAGTTDLMFLMDDSGSLYGTDPAGVRYQAVQQLTSRLSDGAIVEKAGLAYFIDTATVAVPLTSVSSAVSLIQSATSGTASSPVRPSMGAVEFYGNGIQGAAAEFAAHASSGAKKVIVLFTDGGSVYTNYGSYTGAVDPVAAARAAAAQGITVNIVLLGSGTTVPTYITDIANAGGGKVYAVTDATQLLTAFSNPAIINSGSTISTEIQKAVEKAQTTAISAQVQRATTIQQAVTIINVLSSIGNPRAAMGPQRVSLGQNKNGMAAGGVAGQWNVWMNVSRAEIDNTYQNVALGADTRFDGNVDNWIGGFDYGLDKDWVVGASIGYDKTSIDTYFNNGNLTSKGTMIAPYVSFQLNKTISLDAILGYAEGDSDILSNLVTPTTGKQDFTRNFGALNLSAIQWIDNWQMTGKVSYIIAEEKLKDFTNSAGAATQGQTNRMQQIRLGAQVGYWADGIMPYVGLTYSNDLDSPDPGILGTPRTRDAYTAAVGINVFAKDLMGSLSYTSERGRSHSKNDILMGSLSYRF